MFQSLFNNTAATISVTDFLLCLAVSLVLGGILAFSYLVCNRYTKSFLFTLTLLPTVVCVVIMLVNGNIGTGVAVAGAFSLVRFRSVPGTAKEIGVLFVAMGIGLIAGMGYLGYAAVFAVLMALVIAIFNRFTQGAPKSMRLYKTLSVTIPEDLDYTDVFQPVLAQYTRSADLVRVKTTNMGSMFRLTYNITLKPDANEKALIDQLRCRNGNLEICISCQDSSVTEL